MELNSEGECIYCKKTFSSTKIPKHLLSCEGRMKNFGGSGSVFLIRASAGPFFAYFEANANSTLEDIDEFLRYLWLECCGHLSLFEIDKERYYSYCEDNESQDKKMDEYKLLAVLKEGSSFFHEYDFGTTTYLELKVIQKRKGNLKKIELIARNNPLDFKCECGNKAKDICPQCICDGKDALLCINCANKHECMSEEEMLPLVNSPRMGMCGYTGD